jgi:beta-glucanase (GH16 family)
MPNSMPPSGGPVLDRSAWDLRLEETFDGAVLDPDRWVAHYLPQWSTPERSAARYDLSDGVLRLRIDHDQPAWRDEDGQLRVSNLQTATFAGPVGSDRGTHRHRPDLRVRTAVPHRQLCTLTGGLVEARLRATADPTCMLALWLVGVEDASPDDAGEICIAELYGHAVGHPSSTARLGIKAHHDPRLTDDMVDVALDIDATDWHDYAAAWTAEETRFYVDDQLVRVVPQGIGYPLQIMIDLFEFPEDTHRDPAAYPKTAEVAAVRAYRPRR